MDMIEQEELRDLKGNHDTTNILLDAIEDLRDTNERHLVKFSLHA